MKRFFFAVSVLNFIWHFPRLYALLIFTGMDASNQSITDNSSCGSWQNSYKFLHQAILDGIMPDKFLVSVPVRAGLADNLIGMVSQFLLAFLTSRAFVRLSSFGNSIPLGDIFTPARISWNNCSIPSHLFSGILSLNKTLTCPQQNDTILKWNGMSICSLNMVNSANTNKIFQKYNLSNILSGKDDSFQVIAIAGNRGSSIQLFKNPLYADYLKEIGLRPETIFSCIFNYHFRL